MKKRKKLIIFDFDGTLGDTRHIIVTTMQMTMRELQLPERSGDECASTIGLPLAGASVPCFLTCRLSGYSSALTLTDGSSTKTCGG